MTDFAALAKKVADAVRTVAPGGRLTDSDVFLSDALARNFLARTAHHVLGDPAAFFERVRRVTGALDQEQVDTINGLLNHASHWSIAWMAYGLATAWHEARLKPQPEWGKGAGKPYGRPQKYGQAPYGRGLVQLTHDKNYEWADEALGLDGSLLADFDRALEPTIAARILVKGMEEGAFTTKSLANYLPDARGSIEQFTAARRIINGTDKATEIAEIALAFQDALVRGRWG